MLSSLSLSLRVELVSLHRSLTAWIVPLAGGWIVLTKTQQPSGLSRVAFFWPTVTAVLLATALVIASVWALARDSEQERWLRHHKGVLGPVLGQWLGAVCYTLAIGAGLSLIAFAADSIFGSKGPPAGPGNTITPIVMAMPLTAVAAAIHRLALPTLAGTTAWIAVIAASAAIDLPLPLRALLHSGLEPNGFFPQTDAYAAAGLATLGGLLLAWGFALRSLRD